MNTMIRDVVCVALMLVATSAGAQQAGRTVPLPTPTVGARHSGVPRPITERQRENMLARLELATAVVDRYAAEARARGLASGWRHSMLEHLLSLPMAALERVSREASGMDSVAALIAEATDDPQQLGNEVDDLVYVPIAPCRFVDTRNAGGAINGIRTFDLDLTGSSYGGSGACNPRGLIQSAPTVFGAFAANLTIVSPAAAPGFAAIKPTQGSPVSSLLNWYEAGAHVQAANAGIFTVNYGALFLNNQFVIQTSASAHAILDLLGFFVPPEATALQRTTTVDLVAVGPGDYGSAVPPTCPAGFTETATQCGTTGTSSYLTDVREGFCAARNTSGFSINLIAWRICVRVPGR